MSEIHHSVVIYRNTSSKAMTHENLWYFIAGLITADIILFTTLYLDSIVLLR